MSLSNYLPKKYQYLLPIGFAEIIVLMIFTNFFAFSLMRNNLELMVDTMQQHIYSDDLLEVMTQTSFDQSMVIGEIIQSDDPFKNDELLIKLNVLATTFLIKRTKFESQELGLQMQKTLNTESVLSRYLSSLQLKIFELIKLGKKDEAVIMLNDQFIEAQRSVHDIIHEMTQQQHEYSQASIDKLEVANSKTISIIWIFNLISIAISALLIFFILKKQREGDAKLTLLANTDTLTTLPNRSAFKTYVDETIKANLDNIFALVFLDIDYFKKINDNYGHDIGDEILKRYALKIKSLLSRGDVISRFGGDEFVLLLRSIKSIKEAEKLIASLSKSLNTSFVINNKAIFITSSIGVSIYSKDGFDAKTLLHNADIAMYSAKESGRNCYQFFSSKTRDKIERGHAITYALHTILKSNNVDNELSLKFQPLINIAKNNVTECEALIRWKTTDGIDIPPEEFIAHAEESNLIGKINDYVIDESCQQQKHWQELAVINLRININLSGNKKIFAKSLARLDNKIKELGLSPSLFGIELTERTMLEVSHETIEKLKEFRSAGMKIAIDDFGTGYSSLSYLKKFPITTIKIDKSFVSGLPEDKNDRELVKSIISLGHSLKLDIVAEGIERIEQLDFLRTYSCDIAQGYYFHYPLRHNQITDLKIAA